METIQHPPLERALPFELPRVLVVGTDLTTLDRNVGTVAIRLAILLDATVQLVHVVDTGLGDAIVEGEPNEVMHRALTARVRARVAAAEEELDAERVRIGAIDRDGHAIVRVTLANGRPWDEIVDIATELRRAWIVVGGRPGAKMLGHTSDHVLRHGAMPVLVVPEGCPDTLAGPVVVAVDVGDHGHALLRAGGELARALGRALVVFHVHPAGNLALAEPIARALREVPAAESTSRTLELVAQTTSVAHAITAHLRANATSLVVVGAGRHGLAERVLGSTATSLAHTSPAPVLVVR